MNLDRQLRDPRNHVLIGHEPNYLGPDSVEPQPKPDYKPNVWVDDSDPYFVGSGKRVTLAENERYWQMKHPEQYPPGPTMAEAANAFEQMHRATRGISVSTEDAKAAWEKLRSEAKGRAMFVDKSGYRWVAPSEAEHPNHSHARLIFCCFALGWVAGFVPACLVLLR